MSVPMAIALSGHLLLGQPVMVKPSEAEKNLVQTNASGGGSAVGPYGAVDRKLYVGNLHFNMTEFQLKQTFEAFGPMELVQLPLTLRWDTVKVLDLFRLVLIDSALRITNVDNLDIFYDHMEVSSVTDHIGVQDTGAKAADFDDDDDGGGLSLNAQSRALLMQKLDRSGIGTRVVVVGSLGVPMLNGAASNQQAITLPFNGQTVVPAPVLPALVTSEPIGKPILSLETITQTDLEFDLDIKEDVQEECSKYGRMKHIYVDKMVMPLAVVNDLFTAEVMRNSAGNVYLRFETVEAAAGAQRAMHNRWFAHRLISAVFLQSYEYDAKFKGAA
ncbi:hypothetical protein Vadar_030869 [Vaccinium darrowii]|uniref:Uncharacterized protein n=1 Tax=Vaccinium darrowii TaxID=229202 RepID=A0ACB7Z7T0_9ERIC|nr:hypothetical protein Vadar_030869 [Vaccinium darrowii]